MDAITGPTLIGPVSIFADLAAHPAFAQGRCAAVQPAFAAPLRGDRSGTFARRIHLPPGVRS